LNEVNFIRLKGERKDPFIGSIASIYNANLDSITWLNPDHKDSDLLFSATLAGFIVIKNDNIYEPKENQILIEVENPKYVFTLLANKILKYQINYSIDKTAVISKNAKIHSDVRIGPYCVIGDCEIGKGTIIEAQCNIGDNTKIGCNVYIGSGSKIANIGFGFATADDGSKVRFPHIGGVIIEDNVEIGANVCVDKGALSDTIIRKGVKIDNLVHIAHNVEIGERSCVVALAIVGGSTKIGNDVWIAPSSSLRDAINIGDATVIGMGAVVTKSVPSGEIWGGNPARRLK
jgi:UDP-3-O-[3-hydroxymyristoyl] glucosamine N-acyltransferase